MDNDLIIVEELINRVSFQFTWINIGYEYYSIVDRDFTTELWLPRIKIPLNPITGFIKKNTKKP